MCHWAEQICRYGALQQYPAKRHEQAHKTNLKDGWNSSNHNLNYLPQVITFQYPILCFRIWELNLQALAQCRENSAATCNVLPSGADLAAPLRFQSYAKPKFRGPQNRHDGKHPDAMIKDFRALLDNTQDWRHRVTIYNSTPEFIKHESRNKTYILDEQLHAMECCIYHSLRVQVACLEREPISLICWCTGSQSWREGDRWDDWVWAKQRPGRCYGALNGRLRWQLQWPFKIKLLNKDGTFVEYWLALALTTIPEKSGNLDPVSNFVQVRKAPTAVALQVFSVDNIVGCAHVIPAIATSSKTGDGQNQRWIVNSHIDLATWNNEYNYQSENCILHTGRRNARQGFHSVTHQNTIWMQLRTLRTHSDVWSQLATKPECSFKIGDRQREKKRWNRDERAICNVTHRICAGCRVSRPRDVSDGSDWPCSLWPSHSAWTEMFFADVVRRWMSPTTSNASVYWDRWYEDHRVRQ